MASQIRRRDARNKFNKKGLMALYLAFSHKFGRPPCGNDPVFFDPEADRPCSLPQGGTQRLLLEAMLETGTAPQLVYAFSVTGFDVSDKTRADLSPGRRAEWDNAVRNYLAFGFKTKSISH